MHALRLLPHHLLRTAALAAALTVAIVLAVFAGRAGDGSPPARPPAAIAPAPLVATGPTWVVDPVAPVTPLREAP